MKDSKIGWCHHTFNPWWGCTEVSPACDFCYARTFAKRVGQNVWGADAPRRFFGDKHWDEPLRWNEAAVKAGVVERVFIASMCDWGEERNDKVGAEMGRARERLWRLIEQLTSLNVLLLTKRTNAYRRHVPKEILALARVWPGTTIERPAELWRLDVLKKVQSEGPIWVSHEPALERTDFNTVPHSCYAGLGLPHPDCEAEHGRKLDWLVVGVESRGSVPGRNAEEYDALALDVIEQCRRGGVRLFHKQRPVDGRVSHDPSKWPPTLRVQQFPIVPKAAV